MDPYLEASLLEGQDVSLPENSRRSRQSGLLSKAPVFFALCLLGVAVVYFAYGSFESDSRLTRTADELQHTQSLLETQAQGPMHKAIKDKINAVEKTFSNGARKMQVPTETALNAIRDDYSQIFTQLQQYQYQQPSQQQQYRRPSKQEMQQYQRPPQQQYYQQPQRPSKEEIQYWGQPSQQQYYQQPPWQYQKAPQPPQQQYQPRSYASPSSGRSPPDTGSTGDSTEALTAEWMCAGFFVLTVGVAVIYFVKAQKMKETTEPRQEEDAGVGCSRSWEGARQKRDADEGISAA